MLERLRSKSIQTGRSDGDLSCSKGHAESDATVSTMSENTQSRGKVVMFYPPYDGPPLGAPLCLLALAGTLREANFEVVLIDAAIEPEYLEHIRRECTTAVCVGISVLTGPMIHGAIAAARQVKEYAPSVPVILGGWHPTLCPESTVREPYVDIVVRGQGEITIVEVASALRRRQTARPGRRHLMEEEWPPGRELRAPRATGRYLRAARVRPYRLRCL